MRIFLFLCIAAVAAAAGVPLVQAQDNSVARSLAATCANCHGTDGRSVTKEVIPLAGLPQEVLVGQLKAFREGALPATVMQQIVKGYTEQQIDLIAGYFAAQPKASRP
jgi:cytochrome c553